VSVTTCLLTHSYFIIESLHTSSYHVELYRLRSVRYITLLNVDLMTIPTTPTHADVYYFIEILHHPHQPQSPYGQVPWGGAPVRLSFSLVTTSYIASPRYIPPDLTRYSRQCRYRHPQHCNSPMQHTRRMTRAVAIHVRGTVCVH